MTPGYAEVTFTIDFEIFSISRVSQVVHANFTSVLPWQLQTPRLATFDSLHEQQYSLSYFFIRSTRTMMDFSQKLHRTETLS